MGQHSGKNIEKQPDTHQINFLNIASGSGLSIPSQRRTPNTSQIPKEQVWNTIFRWPFGGESVFITGSFTNWRNQIALAKVGNEFNVILSLPAGVHKYKFIVDGEWKFSLLDPTCLDEYGNVNNILDTTNYNPKISEAIIMGSGSGSGSGSGFIEKYGNNNVSPNLQIANKSTNAASPLKRPIEEKKESTPKNKIISLFNEGNFDSEAQITPPHLLDIYFITEKDKRIKEVWKKEEGPCNSSNNYCSEGVFRAFESFNSIPPPTHVILNHFGAKKEQFNDSNVVFVLTERFKGKYATIKFYTLKEF